MLGEWAFSLALVFKSERVWACDSFWQGLIWTDESFKPIHDVVCKLYCTFRTIHVWYTSCTTRDVPPQYTNNQICLTGLSYLLSGISGMYIGYVGLRADYHNIVSLSYVTIIVLYRVTIIIIVSLLSESRWMVGEGDSTILAVY